MADIEKSDKSTFMDKVKDKIKASFVELIPEENWDKLVDNEIKAFFETPEDTRREIVYERGSWNVKDKMVTNESPFRQMVWDLCYQKTKDTLEKKIDEQFFIQEGGKYYDSSKVTPVLEKIITKMAPIAAAQFFKSMGMMAVQDIRNELMNIR